MDEGIKKSIDELANSLQTVTLLSTRLRWQLSESAQEALELEAAANKAVRAIRNLKPPRSGDLLSKGRDAADSEPARRSCGSVAASFGR